MSRHFVLDFDGTLINTDVYWEWVSNQFLALGVEMERVKVVGEALFPFRYTVAQHATNLGLEPDVIQDVTQRSLQYIQEHHANLLFPDVIPFLKRFAHVEKSVLTFGDEENQMTRVIASGLQPHVQDIRVATPENSKAVLLTQLMETATVPIVFIDDDVEQLMSVYQADLPVELIRMRRPGQRKSIVDHELDDQSWRVIRSLSELE